MCIAWKCSTENKTNFFIVMRTFRVKIKDTVNNTLGNFFSLTIKTSSHLDSFTGGYLDWIPDPYDQMVITVKLHTTKS